MLKRPLQHVSLAAKCRLLFGAAVALILAATMFLPWVQMSALSGELTKRRAEQAAEVVRLTTDLRGEDWTAAQEALIRAWPTYAKLADLPATPPRLIQAANPRLLRGLGVDGFVTEAIDALSADPTRRLTWEVRDQDGVEVIRLAMAVRGAETDPTPSELRGIIDVSMPVESHFGAWNLLSVVLAGASGGALSILVFYLITKKLFLSPVRHLKRVAQQVTSGDLEVRSTVATGDEFEDLSDAFNDMLAHLKATQDELRLINRSLDVKLGELAETNVALFEANRVKSEFLANVSHELRTPLSSIIGFAELLREAGESGADNIPRLRRYADNILVSGRMLLEIINDLLDLAKIEAGKMELHLSEFNVADVCESLVDFVRPLAEKKNITLTLVVEPDIGKMRSDSGKVKQVLYNLLSNAIKFTPTGGSVSLTAVRCEDDRVRLTVSDTGPGIDPSQHAAIFEKFRQLDSSVTRQYEGTGLGLAITKELVQMLGGHVKMDSEPDKGAHFHVTLPRCAPEQSGRPPVDLVQPRRDVGRPPAAARSALTPPRATGT